MWKVSRYSSSALTLAILAASAALVTSDLYDDLKGPVTVLVDPAVRLFYSIGTLFCTPVKEVVTSDTPPDLSQLNLQYRTQNTTITLKLSTAAQQFPATFPQYGPDTKVIVIIHGYTAHVTDPAMLLLNAAVQSTGPGVIVLLLDASSAISTGPNYLTASKNATFVALALCQFFIDLHQLCHVDYWPNGGSVMECCDTQTCDHNRSVEYYAGSIYYRNYLAVKCRSYEDFRKGNSYCSNETKEMGYYCPNDTRGNYFGQTACEQPYGLGVQGTHYDPSRVGVLQNIENGVHDVVTK